MSTRKGLTRRREGVLQQKGHKGRGRSADVPGRAAPPLGAGQGGPGPGTLALVISLSWEFQPERTGAGEGEEAGGQPAPGLRLSHPAGLGSGSLGGGGRELFLDREEAEVGKSSGRCDWTNQQGRAESWGACACLGGNSATATPACPAVSFPPG